MQEEDGDTGVGIGLDLARSQPVKTVSPATSEWPSPLVGPYADSDKT